MISEPALGLRFTVTIDGYGTLGNWSKCEGLTVEFDVHEYNEGGLNTFVHRLPGRAKYQNIKLTRPIDSSSSMVAGWISGVGSTFGRETAQIAVLDPTGSEVVAWSLVDVVPVRWTGPSLDIDSSSVATETLELAHNGFLGMGL
jgi:phage tail-like protein